MGKIRILSPETISKIAAGEVVERPASVVKELVENALDAGSRSIRIEIQKGGKKLIRVTDDGEGMNPEDARLAIERHTTSKIHLPEDLYAIRTFGFRGEALSSIAAVSRMRLTTRENAQTAAVDLQIEGGILKETRDKGAPVGTCVEVRDLFFNIPARLKFMKSEATEMAHIGEVVGKLALANPQTRFELFQDEKRLAHYPVRDEPSSRLVEALGREVEGKMHSFRSQNSQVRIEGFAGEPGLSRTNARGIHLFVNRRPVRDRLLFHAVMESYRNLLPKDRYPYALVFVELPESEIDVNVHPSKWEIKFANSETIHRTVVRTIREMLEKTPWLKPVAKGFQETREMRASFSPSGIPAADFFGKWEMERGGEEPQRPETPIPGLFRGQVGRTYLLFEVDDGLLLVDQHAAHERILMEKLTQEWSGGAIEKQVLLIPEAIELAIPEARVVEEHIAKLEKMGFEIEPAGERSFWMRAIPSILSGREPLPVLREMVQEIHAWGKEAEVQSRFDPLLRMMACHAAIQAHQAITEQEAVALLADLKNCLSPSHCPHGRPTMVRFSHSDLEKMFGRK
jgi:DNA mismatch repair protein MutL